MAGSGIQEAASQLAQITQEQNDFNTFKAALDNSKMGPTALQQETRTLVSLIQRASAQIQ